MKLLIILIGLSFLCSCSEKPLSGIYSGANDTLDFRTDGTVFYNDINGTYSVYNNKVIVIATWLDSMEGKLIATNSIQEVLVIDGKDLIHIYTVKNGETNVDGRQTRYVKQTQ